MSIEDTAPEAPGGADAVVDVDPADGEGGTDAGVVIDQAPQAEVPEGLATADSAEIEEEAAAEEALEVPQVTSEAAAERANEAPAAAAAEAGAGDLGETEARVLTEEDTRSSDEAFDEAGDDEGLSNFERALLLGLGAATVGAVLDDGGRVVESTGDRLVVERDGELEVLKDDDALLRRPGVTVRSRRFDDGSTLTVVERPDSTRVTTIRAANGQVLRRTRTLEDGREVVLFDDTRPIPPVDLALLEELQSLALLETQRFPGDMQVEDLRAALSAPRVPQVDRPYSLQQIRQIRAVRELMPQVDLEAVQFDTGSAVIRPTEAEELHDIGVTLAGLVDESPDEVFLVEGHTDAVGTAAYNLALSDRRAESVALALTEYFGVPPENMVVQGYGEANLAVPTPAPEPTNRRAVVRRITPLLQVAQAN